ncbi:MAG: YifB family Mg chelatase-like AAA ATPase [Bdellovibrionales bacterium]|nr:YifB family Mg chelatase-like AAA ATPase [Bdellovibrionales bacterium]
MLAKIKTCAVIGIEACSVQVEVEVRSTHKSNFTIVGLVDTAVKESKERVLAALKYSGFRIPESILVNLAPAELKKEGSGFDLAIAVGILAASRQIDPKNLSKIYIHGELALDGSVKAVKGAAALAIEARANNAEYLIIPEANAAEASLIDGIKVIPLRNIFQIKDFLKGEFSFLKIQPSKPNEKYSSKCFSQVQGQELVKRAMKIAAVGNHNILMIGPPGCGKSMLAERFPGILPPLGLKEKLETVKIYSAAGLDIRQIISGERPYRTPHHVVSDVGLIGGGTYPKPGEISLAHNGVLFLDEFPEYRRGALEAMRAPLENGVVQISRAKASLLFPAKFQLLAAMNPCPRGGPCDPNKNCKCLPQEVRKYLGKLSEPILDRIDMHIELNPIPLSLITSKQYSHKTETSIEIRKKVIVARDKAISRQGKVNSELLGGELNEENGFSKQVNSFLEKASSKRNLSARAFIRCLRVARTIADLDDSDQVTNEHAIEALSYRSLERLNSRYS